jgi:protein phosphatase PTC1
MIVRFDTDALIERQQSKDIGVEGDHTPSGAKASEAEKIVRETKLSIADGATPAVGVSGSSNSHGGGGQEFKPTMLDGRVEEEPSLLDDEEEDESPDSTPTTESAASMDKEQAKTKDS